MTDERINGLAADMPIATPHGWLAVGQVQPGDLLFCLDAPPQPVVAMRHFLLRHPNAVQVPALALGNPEPLVLLPDQAVALELDQAALVYGDPVVLIPARALVGWNGIARGRAVSMLVVQVRLARWQVIYSKPGLLLGCASTGPPGLHPVGPPGPPLTPEQARHLMTCVIAEEAGAALRPSLRKPGPYAAF